MTKINRNQFKLLKISFFLFINLDEIEACQKRDKKKKCVSSDTHVVKYVNVHQYTNRWIKKMGKWKDDDG